MVRLLQQLLLLVLNLELLKFHFVVEQPDFLDVLSKYSFLPGSGLFERLDFLLSPVNLRLHSLFAKQLVGLGLNLQVFVLKHFLNEELVIADLAAVSLLLWELPAPRELSRLVPALGTEDLGAEHALQLGLLVLDLELLEAAVALDGVHAFAQDV